MEWGLRRVGVLCAVLMVAAGIGSAVGVSAAGQRGHEPVSASGTGESGHGEVLDLNLATAAELRALPGMGDVYVKRVIEGRPYSAKNQLITRGILPQAAYDRIRDRIVAHRPPKY